MPESVTNLVKYFKSFEHTTQGFDELLAHLKNYPKADQLYEADIPSVAEFVALLKIAVQDRHRRKAPASEPQRSRDRMDARVLALTVLEQSLIRPLSNPNFFPRFRQVNRAKFTFQLALRIVKPELINQHGIAGEGCCLIAAMMNQITRLDSPKSALFVSTLFLTGVACLDGFVVRPRAATCDRHNGEMGECDYVILASLRDMATIRPDADYTADICGYLKKAGYISIEDHSFDATGRNHENHF